MRAHQLESLPPFILRILPSSLILPLYLLLPVPSTILKLEYSLIFIQHGTCRDSYASPPFVPFDRKFSLEKDLIKKKKIGDVVLAYLRND